eukprot:202461_1
MHWNPMSQSRTFCSFFLCIWSTTISEPIGFSTYKGDLQCASSTITVTGTTTIDDPSHYYVFRITNSYQSSITISSCNTAFNSKLFVFDDTYNNNAISCDDHPNSCTFCEDPSVFPRNQIIYWENACSGVYYIQIKGKNDVLDVGDYTLSILNCNDVVSPLFNDVHIQHALSCDHADISTRDTVYGTTSSSDDTRYYELQLHEYQRSMMVSNCDSAFDTKLYIYSYNGVLLNDCQDDCGYCSLNEEVILGDMCAGKYFIEVTGFSELDYGAYDLSLVCGGNNSITTSNDGSSFATANGNSVYYGICGFILMALACLTMGVALVTHKKRRKLLRKRREVRNNAMEYDGVESDDVDDDVMINGSFGEGGEEMMDSEVERNMIKYNVRGQTIDSDDDGNPPVAFAASAKMERIDEEPEIEDAFRRSRSRSFPASFELIHHEFNPSIRLDIPKTNEDPVVPVEVVPHESQDGMDGI